MVIDFEKIAEVHQMNFKGGKGALDTRNYVDDKIKRSEEHTSELQSRE